VATASSPALDSGGSGVIDKREILAIAQQTSLTPHVVEKDYVLGWMLAGINEHEELRESWLFKGGTCLKKCFFETYRFSEDLDFTLLDSAQIDVEFLQNAFSEIGDWIYERTGIEMPSEKQEFDIRRNPRGKIMCQGKISYKGPVSPTHSLPRVKLDLTADERVVLPPVRVKIFHPYTDAPEDGIEALAYDYVEAFAEKFRALAERTRPRDLYDVVNLYRNADARPDPQRFKEVLRAKCEFKGIGIPRIADLEPHRGDLEAGWLDMLEHQLPALLPVAAFWEALPEIFDWLEGVLPAALAAMPLGAEHTLVRDRVIAFPTQGGGQNFIEMIRFAAANRLLVEIDYRDKEGNRSTRAIEAYSLRRSQAGEVRLMAVRAEDGKPRSYLIDRILGVKSTQVSFTPRYPIELTPTGLQTIPYMSRSGSSQSLQPVVRRFPLVQRSQSRRSARVGIAGPTYAFKCLVCGKTFAKKSYDATLNKHKDARTGFECYGTFGTYVRTRY
jgi:predicted nucleotidyltransferase component of viral defense system